MKNQQKRGKAESIYSKIWSKQMVSTFVIVIQYIVKYLCKIRDNDKRGIQIKKSQIYMFVDCMDLYRET